MRMQMRPPVYTSAMPAAPPPPFAVPGFLPDPYEQMRAGLLGMGGSPPGLLDMGQPPNALQLRPITPSRQIPPGVPPGGGGGGSVIERLLGRLFGGPNDPTLSRGQNQEVARQARLNAALAMLEAAGPSEVPVSVAQILGRGIAAGQGAAGEARTGMAQANVAARREQAIRGIVGSGGETADVLQNVIEELLASGDVEGARVAATALQSVASMQGRQNPQLEKIDLGSEWLLIDPTTGKERGRFVKGTSGDLERVDLGDRIVWYDASGKEVRSAPKGRSPAGDADAGIASMPVTAQSAVVSAQAVRSAIDRYEELAKDYMSRDRGDRLAGQVGIPSEDRDQQIGQMESAQTALVMELKNLAGLGVLNAMDLPKLEEMIGDPTSFSAVSRDPQFVLSRIPELRRFVDEKVRSFERSYGIKVPGGTSSNSRERMGTHGSGNVLDRYR